jgi:hypothetical protein
MTAHLQEAAIVEATLADEDRFHCRLHVVVDAAPAGPLDQSKRPAGQVARRRPRPLQSQIRELHRLLGKKTLEAEILKEALEHATGSKKSMRPAPFARGFVRGNLISLRQRIRPVGSSQPRWRSARLSPHKQHGIVAPFF